MNRRFYIATVVGSVLMSLASYASTTDNPVGLIIGVYTYTDYGAGDVVVVVENPPLACQHGFWIRMTDAGAKTTFAQVLAAFHAKTPMRMGGYDDQMWAGSTGKYCRLYYAGPTY
jgi:hypothetical protein